MPKILVRFELLKIILFFFIVELISNQCLVHVQCDAGKNNQIQRKNSSATRIQNQEKSSNATTQFKIKNSNTAKTENQKKSSNTNTTKIQNQEQRTKTENQKKSSNTKATKNQNSNAKKTSGIRIRKVLNPVAVRKFMSEHSDYLSQLSYDSTVQCHVIDYVLKEIVDKKRQFKKDFTYIEIKLTSRYLELDQNLKAESDIVKIKKFKGKKIIMPISYHGNHLVAFYADTTTKEAQYYDPTDPKLRSSWLDGTYTSGKKRYRRFIRMLEQRNVFVDENEKIDTNDWTFSKPKIKQRTQNSGNACAIYCFRWIDCLLNGDPLYGHYRKTPIEEYRAYLKRVVLRKMKRMDPKIATQSRESYLYGWEKC